MSIKLGKFIPQYKGKDLGKVAKSKILNHGWYVGIKYDGNYIQIHKEGNRVWMFTSSGIQLMITEVREDILKIPVYSFVIEAEFCNNCQGLKLGDRNKSSTGKARADFNKGISTSYFHCNIMVFDILVYRLKIDEDFADTRQWPFIQRTIKTATISMNRVQPISFKQVNSIEDAVAFGRKQIQIGCEGAFAYHLNHTIEKKGRSNTAIKIKAGEQTSMICVGAEESKEVKGEWGSLILADKNGSTQSYGGLTAKIRQSYPTIPLDKTFTVKYEQFKNNKYIQGFISGK